MTDAEEGEGGSMTRTLWDEHEPATRPDNKFHSGNGDDGKHYWITPPELYAELDAEHRFDFDPCPFPLPYDFDGLTDEWGQSNYVNPPFGSIIHEGKKKGPTAWVRKALAERAKGKRVVLVYPVDKWVLMLIEAGAKVSNLGDVKWLATEDGSAGKGTGRHIACFVLEPEPKDRTNEPETRLTRSPEPITDINVLSIPNLTKEEADAFDAAMGQAERSATATPLDVERLAEAMSRCGSLQRFIRTTSDGWEMFAGDIAAEYSRPSIRTENDHD